jgi:O-antigen/teichoic acid export membrane protein
MSNDSAKSAFFRQSGWMVIATFVGGAAMFAVHIFAPFMGEREYGLFGTLLAMLNLLLIPALALQTVFAQQAAAAITPDAQTRLTGTTRALLCWSLVLWLLAAGSIAVVQGRVLDTLKISNPAALWIILLVGLLQLWAPILTGVLQGRQNFLWLGWAAIINGVGRFLAVAIIVLFLGGKATGAIVGALVGSLGALLVACVQARPVLFAPSGPFDWRNWLARVVPLTLGLGASQFIFSLDMIVVRAVFGENQTGYYSASGMIGRGLVMFTQPLTLVMFPKIVHNLSLGKKTNVLFYTLMTTAALGAAAALTCTAIAFAMRSIVEGGMSFVPAVITAKLRANSEGALTMAQLIPWFVWCMLPLAVANVLLNSLLAAKQFRVVLYLVLVVAAYAAVVVSTANSFVQVIQTLGLFNLLFLAVTAGFFRAAREKVATPSA